MLFRSIVRLLQVTISNFRGIQNTSVELDAGAPGQVVTLIGLNESGKTTILEAIYNFLSSDRATRDLLKTVYAEVDPITFIPKERRGLLGRNFVCVLDADTKGKAEAERYRSEYHFDDEQIMTLDEADGALAGLSFEGIYGDDTKQLIKDCGLESDAKIKAKGSALFQLLLATEDYSPPLEETLARFEKVLEAINGKLALQ